MNKTNKPPLDFQKIRKKRQRAIRLKQLGVLALICFAIVATLYINDALVRRNVTNKLDGFVGSMGGEGFPVNIPSGAIRTVDNMGTNLAILKDSNLYVYSEKGKQIKNIQQMNDRSIIKTTEDKLLYYSTNGQLLTVHSPTNVVYSVDLESTIDYAAIGAGGDVAVIASPPKFVSEITVYSPSGEEVYRGSFAEDMLSLVSVSPKGGRVAAVCISSSGGLLDSNIYLYDIKTSDAPAVIPVGNRLVVYLNFYREDTISLLTDKDFMVYDSNKTALLGSFVFPENTQLIDFRTANNEMILLFQENDTRKYIMVMLDSMSKEIGRVRLDNKPLDITFNEKNVYVLNGNNIEHYGRKLNIIEEHDIEPVERIYLQGARLYLISKTEVSLLSENVDTEQSSSAPSETIEVLEE